MKNKKLVAFAILVAIMIVGISITTSFAFHRYGETVEIHFYTNGGEKLDNVFFTYGKDTLLDKLPVPKKEGYVFKGWFVDRTLETKLRAEPSPNFNNNTIIHLYAKWGEPEKEKSPFNPLVAVILALLIIIVIVFRNVLIKIKESKEITIE